MQQKPTRIDMQATPAETTPTPATAASPLGLDAWIHEQLARINHGLSPFTLSLSAMDWAMHMAASPERRWALTQEALQLTQQWLMAQAQSAGHASTAAVSDHRFSDPAWQQWPYSAWRDAFLAANQWWQSAAQVEGMRAHHQDWAAFMARQWLDMFSPANFAATNPQAAQRASETLGMSTWLGQQQAWQDWLRELTPAPTEANPQDLAPLPYVVGQDVAATPGEVVFRNDLFELIQYTPTTEQVREEPVLIVPSTIMKYYILDLSPHNAMVRYLVAQGFTVFIMSWRNPTSADRDLGMDDYLIRGVMTAMAQTQAQAECDAIHTMGYCLGGTFLAIVAALLQGGRRGSHADWPQQLPSLCSVTLLAAQTDFAEPGELGLFIDEDQLRSLREDMAQTGYLSGRQMGGTFQFLNARDLVWSRHVQRHLLGQDSAGNDMMSWNMDTTRLPARMHNEYLKDLFLDNALSQGRYQVDGLPVALSDISAPMLVVGTEKDHVSPWRSVFKITLTAPEDTTFLLAAGGHNAGIVSEPGHPRRHYRVGCKANSPHWLSPEQWMACAARHEGSWWTAWADWLHERSGVWRAPRHIAPEHSITPAPGDYVMVRYAD